MLYFKEKCSLVKSNDFATPSLIATDGTTYELLEAVEEEYVEGKETPVYRNAKTGEELSYTSLDEVMNKYIANARKI